MRRIDLILLRLRELSVNVLLLLFVVVLFFVFAEGLLRLFFGSHLALGVDDNGFYYYLPNQNGWYDFSYPHVRINNVGSRGNDVDLDKMGNKYVFFGDSFTFGCCLSDNETIPYYFQNIFNLSDDDVLNYGELGYGVNHMISSYDHNKELYLDGDVFIMNMIEDDFYRPMIGKKSLTRDIFRILKKHSAFITFMRANIVRFSSVLFSEEENSKSSVLDSFKSFDEMNFNKLIDFSNVVENNNHTIIFVFYDYNHSEYSERAGLFCRENNLNCVVDVPSYIDEIRGSKDIFAVDGGHPSKYSNEVLAYGLAEYVVGHGFVLKYSEGNK